MSLITGKSVTYPGVSSGNIATDSLFDSEGIKRIMERHHDVTKVFRETEHSQKLEAASETRNYKFNNIKHTEGDLVFPRIK